MVRWDRDPRGIDCAVVLELAFVDQADRMGAPLRQGADQARTASGSLGRRGVRELDPGQVVDGDRHAAAFRRIGAAREQQAKAGQREADHRRRGIVASNRHVDAFMANLRDPPARVGRDRDFQRTSTDRPQRVRHDQGPRAVCGSLRGRIVLHGRPR
jgi:hypothetical protein